MFLNVLHGFMWNGTECCQAYYHEQPAEVFVEKFLTDTYTDATVEAFSQTMDIAIVIDSSGSTDDQITPC